MSKTMNNDYEGSRDATIGRLIAQINQQEQQLQAYESQLTVQEDGTKSLLDRLERQKRNLDYYANENNELRNDGMQLRARVEELEATLPRWDRQFKAIEKERDYLKSCQAINAEQAIDLLREKLTAAQLALVNYEWSSL